MAEDWLTTFDAARLADYHPERIRELVREGKVKARKWGRDWQISRGSLLAYVRLMERQGGKRGPKRRG